MFVQQDTVAIKKGEADKAFGIVKDGGIIVCPTKVGYIIVANSGDALRRKFEYKKRPLKKPAVVLTQHDQLDTIAEVPEKHRKFIDAIQKTKVLCGFIMPRKLETFAKLEHMVQQMTKLPDGSSCFVINHGAYSEYLVKQGVADDVFIFASSANLSGTGNRGSFEGVGSRILDGVDAAIEHDEYVNQRFELQTGEQGVMVSLLEDKAVVIRKGLNLDHITSVLTEVYGADGWIMNHGAYA